MKKRIIAALAVLLLAAGGWALWKGFSPDGSGPLTLYGNVDIRTVNLSFRVGGRLAQLNVDEGDQVEAGQILGLLDAEPHRISLLQAQAGAAAQKAALALLESGYRHEEIDQARAEVERLQSAFNYAARFYERQKNLFKTRAVSANDVDNARTASNQAEAALKVGQEKLRQLEAGYRVQEIDQARAALLQAEAVLAQAELNLKDTSLLSPAAGTILTRALEPGSMLGPGSPVFTLSLTRPVWVRAYVGETSLGQAVPGRKVSVSTDSSPDKSYTGSIGFVSPTAEFTPKTVQTPELRPDLVYRLRIIITDPDDALRQGMPVTIRFMD